MTPTKLEDKKKISYVTFSCIVERDPSSMYEMYWLGCGGSEIDEGLAWPALLPSFQFPMLWGQPSHAGQAVAAPEQYKGPSNYGENSRPRKYT